MYTSDMTYKQARAAAQSQANSMLMEVGIERTSLGGYTWFLLPRPENRYGHELRCEVVTPVTNTLDKPSSGA